MRRILLFCLLAVIWNGCTTRYQTRGVENPLDGKAMTVQDIEGKNNRNRQIDLEARSVESYKDFSLGVIEFNDDGQFNPTQQTQVFEMVQQETMDGALLVVFAHGWHHGPRVCDQDLACFRRVLQKLAEEKIHPGRVIGVYLGWRGESLVVENLNVLTLWSRKRAAEHIGRTGGKEILLGLHDIWASRRDQGKPVTMITVGHSLGGALVFSAVKGKMRGNIGDIVQDRNSTFRTVRAQGDRAAADGNGEKAERARFGDLVVLVNPALQASEYTPFHNDLPDKRASSDPDQLLARELPPDKQKHYAEDQLPILLVVASEADTAVGRLFPVARWLQGQFFSKARWAGMGRYNPHVTHELERSSQEPIGDDSQDGETRIAPNCSCNRSYGLLLKENATKLSLAKDRQNGNWDPHSPYLVVRTDKSVIGNHNDIFNPVLVGFLTRYLQGYLNQKEEMEDLKRTVAK